MCQFCVCMSHIFFPSRRSSPRRSRSPVRRDRARQSDSRSSYDVLNGQDEIELPEEIIPAWLRCSPADLYFRRNNEVLYARNLSKIERLRGMYNTVHVHLSPVTTTPQESLIDEQASLTYRYFILYLSPVTLCLSLLPTFINMFEFQTLYMFFRLAASMLQRECRTWWRSLRRTLFRGRHGSESPNLPWKSPSTQ